MKARQQFKCCAVIVAVTIGALFVGACEGSKSGAQTASVHESGDGAGEPAKGEEATSEGADVPAKGSPAAAPRIVRDEGEMPTPDTPLATGTKVRVTVGDFEVAMRRSLLFAPPREDGTPYTAVPAERLATPHVHVTATQSLVARQILLEEAAARGIRTYVPEEEAFMANHPTLSRFAGAISGPEDHPARRELAKLGLDVEDLRAVIQEELYTSKLQELLMSEIDNKQLWEAYQARHDTVDLVVAWVNNTPTSQELDQFLEEDARRPDPRIDAHYEANRESYATPATVQLTMLRTQPGQQPSKQPGQQPGADDKPEERVALADTLAQAANRLSSGEAPESAASGLGLVLETEATLVAGENPRAFAAAVGDTGFELEGPRGPYAWIVTGHTKPEPLPLSRPLRREIAAELLRQQGALPGARARLTPVLEVMRRAVDKPGTALTAEQVDRLRESIEQLGVTAVHTGAFPRSPLGYVPRVGLAEELMGAAFAEADDADGMANEPILSRDRVLVFAVVGRHKPTRAEFERDLESFRKSYLQERRTQVVHELIVHRQFAEDVEIDTRPLRIKYGVVQKN